MKYLNDKQYYIDRYDLFTIMYCLEALELCTKAYKDLLQTKGKDKSKGEMAKASSWFANQVLYQKKAQRYSLKDETIQKWIEEDSIKQEKYDTTPQPRNIRCLDCKKIMQSSIKHLETLDDPMRMMFLFNCPSCKKKRWIYEDGTERESKPDFCPKCKSEAKIVLVKEGENKIIWKTTCPSCGFSETTVDDLAKGRREQKKREEIKKKYLEAYREEFCSGEQGKEAFEYVESLKVAHVVYDEELKKYDSFAYQMVANIKKLSIVDLEKLLHVTIEKESYSRLIFDNPQIGQHVIVQFSLQDTDSSRNKDKSVDHLQKLIKKTLEGTNWRLMSDGLSYRLGLLSGRLKGYEREEDLFELSGEKKEEKISKLDYETRMKYEGSNVVQLARLSGEFKGIQNVRERRLEKEPDGFFLESQDDYYNCGICGESMAGNKTWWNLDGVRCADCQRNIKEGVISAEIHKKDDIWIKDWQLSSEYDFNLHSMTVRKLRREGLLHGRDLKREDGSIYFTVFLIEENKEFLKKYPRKPRNKTVIKDLLGDKVEL